MKKTLPLLLILTLALQENAIASTAKLGWRESLLLGYGITSADQTQTVHLADTPSPGLDNQYVGNSTLFGATLLGVGLAKEFDTAFKSTIIATGLEVDYLRNNSVKGVVEPMINVSPDFDVLHYSYDIQSFLLQATAQITKHEMLYPLDGYFQLGLGAAMNRLYNYNEFTPGDSTAAPMLTGFGNKNTLSPAFSTGVGLAYKIEAIHTLVSLGYRYTYTGKGQLAASPIQQTNAKFTLSPISYHLLMLTLTV